MFTTAKVNSFNVKFKVNMVAMGNIITKWTFLQGLFTINPTEVLKPAGNEQLIVKGGALVTLELNRHKVTET